MMRSLPPLMSPALEDRAPSPLPPFGHDISRPSSTSTQSSSILKQQHHQQRDVSNISLPGLATLASVASAPSPQMRAFSGINQGLNYPTASPTPTSVSGQGNSPPICQNCSTSTTPLWRRDEIGSVLCNACGLFLKLHGRPRPISLKTDVIKSRNRVKSSGQGQKKKSMFNSNGVSTSRSEAGTPPPGSRRVSQKSSGTSDRSHSPISRATTPAFLSHSNIAPHHFFENPHLGEPAFVHSTSLPAFHLRHPSPGSTTSLNDRHLEPSQPYEALHQANTSLKTRISELEVINGLYKGRVQELERSEAMQNQLRQALDQSQAREDELKRRLDDLEREVSSLRKTSPVSSYTKRRLDIKGDLINPSESSPPSVKRTRLSDSSNQTEAS